MKRASELPSGLSGPRHAGLGQECRTLEVRSISVERGIQNYEDNSRFGV